MKALCLAPTVYRNDLFAGRVAIVSGGGSGLSRAVALCLAPLGDKVAICGRTAEKLDRVAAFARSKNVELLTQATNVRQPEQIAALYERVTSELGLPDILVNIVAVVERGMPSVAHTIAARADVVGVTRTVAVEWAPLGIRVNCLTPGLTATEGLQVYPPEAHAEFSRGNPMRRLGMEIAEACIYLCGPSGTFITGEVLTVDGGGKLWGELWTAGRPDYFKN